VAAPDKVGDGGPALQDIPEAGQVQKQYVHGIPALRVCPPSKVHLKRNLLCWQMTYAASRRIGFAADHIVHMFFTCAQYNNAYRLVNSVGRP
jgi:hypothetical protein